MEPRIGDRHDRFKETNCPRCRPVDTGAVPRYPPRGVRLPAGKQRHPGSWPRRLPTRTRKLPRPAMPQRKTTPPPRPIHLMKAQRPRTLKAPPAPTQQRPRRHQQKATPLPTPMKATRRLLRGHRPRRRSCTTKTSITTTAIPSPTRTAGCCWVLRAHRRTRRANDQRMGLRSRHPRVFLLGRLAAESHVD